MALAMAEWSDNTVRAYRTAIGLFLQFLDNERGDQFPSSLAAPWRPFAVATRVRAAVGKRTVWRTVWEYRGPAAILGLVDGCALEAFRAWRQQQGDSPNAVSARVYAVQTFLRIALREGQLRQDQAAALGLKPYRRRHVHDEQPAGRRLLAGEVVRLRSVCDIDTVKGKRDLAILDAILYAGLDAHELAAMRNEDLRQERGDTYLLVTGKGRQTRRVKVPAVLRASLADWLCAAGMRAGERGYMFRSVNKGGHVTRNAISPGVVLRLVAEYGCAAGLSDYEGSGRLTARDLRRTCARNAYDNGANLLLVQAMLGQNDPKTTVRYIGACELDAGSATDYVKY
jgi:integrase